MEDPARIPDLLGYQVLIVEARMEYEGNGWLGYDRRFRLMAAAVPGTIWAKIEPTIWSMAFAWKGRTSRCKYCFSLSHSDQHCELSQNLQQTSDTRSSLATSSMQSSRTRPSPICNEWNYNPAPRCPIPRCRYRHICIPCSRNPRIADKGHKAMFCPNFPVQPPTIPSLVQPPLQSNQAQQGPSFSQGYSGSQRFQPY